MSGIVPSVSLSGYFQEVVEGAIKTQKVEATGSATHYLVGLLSDYAKPGKHAEETLDRSLTLLFDEAMRHPDPGERFERLRVLGDGVLYTSGFFRDHFESRGVDPKYVEGIGAAAYHAAGGMMAHKSSRDLSVVDIFDELSTKFSSFVAVVSEVAHITFASSGGNTSAGIVRVYERWLKTGNTSLAKTLGEHGLLSSTGGKGILQ